MKRKGIAITTIAAATCLAASVALADTPGSVITVTPSSGLADTQSVTVSGTGFTMVPDAVNIQQCTADLTKCSEVLAVPQPLTDVTGAFPATAVTVKRVLVPDPPGPGVDCGVVACVVQAKDVPGNFATKPISFASAAKPPTATTPTGQRSAALKKCAKIKNKKKKKKCKQRARKLPV